MPDSYTINNQSATYFLTFQVVAWVDVFTRPCYRDIVVDSFNYCIEHKGLNVHAWVIMSNHVHCILSSRDDTLSASIRDLKRHTAKLILAAIENGNESRREWMLFQFKRSAQQHSRNEIYQFWHHDNHAILLDPFIPDMAEGRFNYIHENPVRAGIVEFPEEYLYSSARDYAGKKGLIKLDMW